MARLLSQALALAAVAGSLVAAGPTNPTCAGNQDDQAVYTAPSGDSYQILCGTDYGGGDVAGTYTDTFALCIDACDAYPTCIDVSYVNGACYLKDRLTTTTPARPEWVWTAKKVVAGAGASDAAPAPLTCEGGADDKKTYSAPSGKNFQVLCGIDYAGDDMAATHTDSFGECVDACDSTSGCIDVSYVNGACYMKKTIREANERGHVWTAKVVETAGGSGPNNALSCVDNKSNGEVFKGTNSDFDITCGKDYAGGDLAGQWVDTFQACIEACDANPACVNVAFVAPACYLKGEQRPAVDAPAVWGAVRKARPTPEPSTTTSTAGSGASTGTATTKPAGTQAPLSCDNGVSNGVKYTGPSGGLYEIVCGGDYGGNDLTATTAESFEDCIAACDRNHDCVDVSFVAPSCYLKQALGELAHVGHVWTAKQLRSPKVVFAFPTATPMDIGSGTEQDFFEAPIELPAAPIATLGPVPPPGVNMAGTGVLTPEPEATLWYHGEQTDSDGTVLDPTTVKLSITYNYPSIVLDHSVFIRDVVCEAGSLHGRYNISYPYYFAQGAWPVGEDFLLITSAESCAPETGGTAFFLAHTVTFDDASLSFEANGQPVELKDIFAEMDIDFGELDLPENVEEDDTCGTPASGSLRGLPAVACGTNFDSSLDDALGYYSEGGLDEQAVMALVGPPAEESGLQKRGWLSSIFKAVVTVVKAVVKVVAVVVQKVVEVVKKAVEVVVSVAVAVAKVTVALAVNAVKLVAFAVTGKYENSLTLPISMGPPSNVLVDSPWGKAFKVYTFKMGEDNEKFSASQAVLDNLVEEFIGSPNPEPGIEIFCVNCGIRGSVKATGKINATPLSGVKEASIGISGNMYAGLYLGVNAFTKWEKEWEKEIFSKGLPGWSIPGIVTLGPKLILSAKTFIGAEAEGQLLTGGSLTWPDFHATLDIADPSKSSQGGWKPVVDTTFQVRGAIEATAGIGLPVKLWFGIDLLNGVFKKGAALVDTPALVATAEFEVNVGTEDTSVGNDECQGIAWDISITNEVSLEIDDGPEFTLHEWAGPTLAEGCIGRSLPGDDEGGDDDDNGPPKLPELPEDDGSLKCPAADGTTYTDDKGNQWQIRCGYDYMNYDIAQTNVNTREECMAWCATQPNCAGVSWVQKPELYQGKSCWARDRAGPVRRDPTIDSMMLMSPFEIISVVYGTRDFTSYAVQNWQVGNRIDIDTTAIARYVAANPSLDGHRGVAKSISMLYRYGAETRSWVYRQDQGLVRIRPGPVGSSASAGSNMLVPDSSFARAGDVNWIQIVDVTYGPVQIRAAGAWYGMYNSAKGNSRWPITNEYFQSDPWVGIVKEAVVWYRDIRSGPNGPLYMVSGIEGNQLALMRSNGAFSKRDQAPSQIEAGNAVGVRAFNPDGGGGGGGGFIPPTTTSRPSTTVPPPTEIAVTANPTTTTTAAAAATTTSSAAADVSSNTASATASETASDVSSTTATATATSSPSDNYLVSKATIRDTTDALEIYPGANGNLFASIVSSSGSSGGATVDISPLLLTAPAGRSFSAISADTTHLVPGDGAGRYLHYFPSEIAALGATRLRLASWDKLPKTSKLINLVPVPLTVDGAELDILVGVPSADEAAAANPLFPVMCAIENQLNKVFLVTEEVWKDEAKLKAALGEEEGGEDVKFVLTGGKASQCVPLALKVVLEDPQPVEAGPPEIEGPGGSGGAQ